jgi:hypothetical protein
LAAISMSSEDVTAARSLLCASAVRSRAHEMLDVALKGGLEHWTVDLDQLQPTAQFVAGVIRDQYPDLKVPFHARWRHFRMQGRDLWAEIAALGAVDAASRGRAAFDLAITSVLLDAGAGSDWQFADPAGVSIGRSEGLAFASLRLFEAGVLSASPTDPLRADARVLAAMDPSILAQAFQVRSDNPLLGLEGRAALLGRLGAQALGSPDLFATSDDPRPGGLFDILAARAAELGGRLPAPAILDLLLEALGPIWEGRLSLGGLPLGDCWRHPAIRRDDPTDGLVPIHKLSQWLAYSLIEPLQDAGIEVIEIDGLTGLAEYRNGGLLIDQGVLVLRHPADLTRAHEVSDPLVVGWRSLTVALLDQLAAPVREALGVTAEQFPLARMLEGGTWAAGRRVAAARRKGGGPPLNIISDGTVF